MLSFVFLLHRCALRSLGGRGVQSACLWVRHAAVSAIATGLLLAQCLPIAHAAQGETFEWDSKVVRGQLGNGLSYYVVRVDGANNQVGMQLLVRVGSLDERNDQSGVAHMVEHMVFHATPRYPQGVQEFLKQQGMTVGQHYNAQTNYTRTQYTLALNASVAKLGMGLDVLREIAGSAPIPAHGLERERLIVLEEWRTKLGVRERMERQRRALLRAGSLYPDRPTIGLEQSIRTQTPQALRDFYNDWYRPGNMALVVVGDVDPSAMVAAIEHRFADMKNAPLPERHPVNATLGSDLRIARMQDAESGSSQVGWVQRYLGDHRQDSDGLRQRLIDRVAERMARGRALAQSSQLPEGVESLTVRKGELGGQVESLGFTAGVGLQSHSQGLLQILQLQASLLQPLDPQLVAKEVREIQRLNARGVAARDGRDIQGWMQVLGDALSEQKIVQDAEQKQKQVEAILPTLTATAVQERLRAWLGSTDRLLFMMAPGDAPLELPSVSDVLAAQRRQWSTWQGTQVAPVMSSSVADSSPAVLGRPAAPGEGGLLPEPGTSGSVVQERWDARHGVFDWVLSNGDRLVWLPEPTGVAQQPNRLRIVAQSGAGYRREGAAAWEWQLAAQLAQQNDLNGQSAGPKTGRARLHTLSFSQEHTETHFRWSAQFSPEQAPDVLAWLAGRQAAANWSASDVHAALRQLLRQQARRPRTISDEQAAAMQQLRWGALGEGDQFPSQKNLQELLLNPSSIGRLQALWADMAGQPMTYFVMGPMGPSELRQLVQDRLAGIPRLKPTLSAQPLIQRPGSRHRELRIAIEPQASVHGHGSQVAVWSPQKAIGVAVLSRAIHRALRTELREKELGVYRLQFSMTLNPRTQRMETDIRFTADPDRIQALWARTLEVLADVPKHVDDTLLERELLTMRKQEQARSSDSATQFHRLQLSVMQWGDFRYLSEAESLQAALTASAVRELSKELHLVQEFCSVMVLPRGHSADAKVPY